jgi:hypothetical protein
MSGDSPMHFPRAFNRLWGALFIALLFRLHLLQSMDSQFEVLQYK